VFYSLFKHIEMRTNGKIQTIHGDLFKSTNSLVHCVSATMTMGLGIAVEFKRRFGRVDELLAQRKQVGQVAWIHDPKHDRYVFYLITKTHHWQKPTLKAMRKCLSELHTICETLGVRHLDMPRIGCGLDRLKWPQVEFLIQEILCPSICVTVYTVSQ